MEQDMNHVPERRRVSLSQRYLRGCSLLEFAAFAAMPWIALFAVQMSSLFLLVSIVLFLAWPWFLFEGLRYSLRLKSVRSFLKEELSAYDVAVNEPD